MSSLSSVAPKKFSWQELDILRAIAAILMIINHAGFKILPEKLVQEGWTSDALFFGSFAPVLFFFVTGVGVGIQSQSSKKDYWISIFYKVLILILADEFLLWEKGEWWGLDFLGFIGIASLIMALLRRTKHSIIYSILGFVLFSGLRYVVAPLVNHLGYQNGFLSFFLGVPRIDRFSYLLSPWLAYPFLGFLMGSLILKFLPIINRKRWLIVGVLFLVSLLGAGAGLYLQKSGASFFRWGTVNIGFYVVSFMVIALGLLCSLIIVSKAEPETSSLIKMLSLRGISSLAIVPIHYFLIYLLALFNFVNLNGLYFIVTIIGLVCLSFYLAHFVNSLSQKLAKSKNQSRVRFTLLTLLGICIFLTIPYNYKGSESLLLNTSAFLGQIILCLMLPLKWW